MIVKYLWFTNWIQDTDEKDAQGNAIRKTMYIAWRGWFLCGFVPLYVEMVSRGERSRDVRTRLAKCSST